MSDIRNLDLLRKVSLPEFPDFGARLYEALSDMVTNQNTMAQQGNFNLKGSPTPPPPIQKFTVQPHENGVEFAIDHTGPLYRGCEYFVDYADNAAFRGARTEHVGENRNGVIPVGTRPFFYQVRAKYANSDSTVPVAHGGSTPLRVRGGSNSAALLPAKGCGTAPAGQPPHLQPPYVGNVPPTRSAK